MITPQEMEAIDNFVEAWRKKGFSKKTEFAMLTIACSHEGVEKFGNEVKSIAKLVEIVDKSCEEQEVIDAFFAEFQEDKTK